MNTDKRKELIIKCRNFAAKGEFCLTLATIYIFCVIVLSNIYSHFKKIIIGGIAALCAAIVLISGYRYYFQNDITDSETASVTTTDTTLETNDLTPDTVNEEKTEDEKPEQKEVTAKVIIDESIKPEDINGVEILVSKLKPIPEERIFILEYVVPGKRCDTRAVQPMKDMLEAAQNEEIKLVISSAYRDNKRQDELFDQKIKKYMNYGYSYLEAYKKAANELSIPGTSEHEIGLGFDIMSEDHQKLDEAFGDTNAGIWLANNSYKYGFILRYPKGKEDITGIQYEPWHFRYVGVDVATSIYNQRSTLEEYWKGR
ncbi:MAG: M15 family metallopeptidase [Lachnospiraceae bacterium]|nr:M15 family metallopeptidase [Lachnospiraceae bacterium]MBP5744853.1 M15 family metallopeptidase [Lachnospiraceae bacterium]